MQCKERTNPLTPLPPLSLTTHETTNQTKTDMKTKDLTAIMAAIAGAHICNFYSDFEHDKRSIESEFAPEEEVSQRFIWMTRKNGTHFSFLRDIPNAALTRQFFLHKFSASELPSYYYYFDGKLYHVSHWKIIEIINEHTK